MIEESLITLIGNVGFPIAISVYLLVTKDKVIGENTKAINELVVYLKEKK